MPLFERRARPLGACKSPWAEIFYLTLVALGQDEGGLE